MVNKKLISLLTIFFILLSYFFPFYSSLAQFSQVNEKEELVKINLEYLKEKNSFQIGINFKNNDFSGTLEYFLGYKTPEKIEGVEGRVPISSEKNFLKEIYAGTCSQNVCVPHQILRGILKIKIEKINWGKSQWFEIIEGKLKIVNEEDTSQLTLSDKEINWLENGFIVFDGSNKSSSNFSLIKICHRTNSHSNPYISQYPNIQNNGDLSGEHLNHTGPIWFEGIEEEWGDIIPPYEYQCGNSVCWYQGMNWNEKGQAIYNNNCQVNIEVDKSSVTICKKDNQNNPLSNWRVYLLKEKVDSFNIPSDGSIVEKSYPTDNYVLLASGTYNYGDERMIADAANSYRYVGLPCSGSQAGLAGDGWVNGEKVSCMANYLNLNFSTSEGPKPPGWGLYFNPEHKYAKSFEGGILSLKIWDTCRIGQLEGCYQDNEGYLTLEIYKGYVGDTEDNGCITFENVSYGEYYLDEILQEGWEKLFVPEKVIIDEKKEFFTLINKNLITPSLTPTPTLTPTLSPSPSITPAPYCGDKIKNQSSEECDGEDGVIEGENFCTTNCKLVPIYKGIKECPVGTVKSILPIITKTISSKDADGEIFDLTALGQYLFEVSGEYNYGQGRLADASYAVSGTSWSTPIRTDIGIWGTNRGVTSLLADLGKGVGVVEWDDDYNFNPNHTYTLFYSPTKNSVQFVISDWYDDWYQSSYNNQKAMGDNSGNLILNIFECLPEKGSILVHKFEDINGNGQLDSGENGLSEWQFNLYKGEDCQETNLLTSGYTNDEGNLNFDDLVVGKYSIKEILQSGWKNTTNNICQNIEVTGNKVTTINFGNFKLGYIQGRKYNDLNQNGVWDQDEPRLGGWKINLYNDSWNFIASVTTNNNNGLYRFENLDKGTYYTCEELKDQWKQTGPVLGNNNQVVLNQSPNQNKEGAMCWRSVINRSGQSLAGRRFGNIQYGAISGYKFEDLNGNGIWDDGEEVISGQKLQVYIFIDLNKDGEQNKEEPVTIIDENGFYFFPSVLPGNYNICEREDLLNGWIVTTPKCQTVSVLQGQETKNINFGNFKLGQLTVVKFHDQNQNKKKDDNEEVLGDWLIKLASDSSVLTAITATNSGEVVFDNLLAGNYLLSEDFKDDWKQTIIYCDNFSFGTYNEASSSYLLTITSSSKLNCYIGNYHTPKMTLSKSNNIYPNFTTPGAVVNFTLKIKVFNNNLYNVSIKDILPPGFSFTNNWSATLNGNPIILPHPNYASPGTWLLGDLKEEDEVVITYQAKVNIDIEPGLYKDLAWAVGYEGKSEDSNKVLGLATSSGGTDPGVISENFVGTKIVVNKDTQNYTTINIKKEEIKKEEEGEVLGASTSRLPATGGKIFWLILGSIFTLLGLVIIGLGLNLRKIKILKKFLMVITIVFLIFLLKVNVLATTSGSISVRLSEPLSPTRFNTFDLLFVALDLENKPLTARCYYKKEGGSFKQFDTVKNLTAGGNVSSCKVTSIQIDEEGKTYYFYVEVTNGEETAVSEIVSVDYKSSAPGTPTSYTKEHPSSCQYKIKFKTADDKGKTKKVEIYRSKETSFALDASTRIASIPIGSNMEYTFLDNVPECDKDWYYAVRAFDEAGNGSGWIGDQLITVVYTPITNIISSSEEISPTLAAIPVANVTLPQETATFEAEVLGEKTSSAAKEEITQEKKLTKSTFGEILGEAVKRKNSKWIVTAGMVLFLMAVGYAIKKAKSKK